jgi:hypothetical protein
MDALPFRYQQQHAVSVSSITVGKYFPAALTGFSKRKARGDDAAGLFQ